MCMYLFLQYYKTFTPELLRNFYEEDSYLKEKEINSVSGRDALRSANGMYSTKLAQKHNLIEKRISKMPFGELMRNFKETFQKVFVDEKPTDVTKYYLSTI